MKRGFLYCVFIFLLSACAPVVDFSIPNYKGSIAPINVPIQPEYKPVNGSFKISSATERNKSNTISEGSLNIQRMGNLLIWNIELNSVVKNRKRTSPKQPLIVVRLLTDKFGEVRENEVTSPAMDAAKIEKDKKEKILKSVNSIFENMKRSLPKKPVKSGDPIHKLNKQAMVNALPKSLRNSNITEKNLEYKIDGWGVFNDQRVIVASIDGNITFEKKGNKFRFRVVGFSLYDPNSFQIVDSKLLLVINASDKNGKRSSESLLQSYSASLKIR